MPIPEYGSVGVLRAGSFYLKDAKHWATGDVRQDDYTYARKKEAYEFLKPLAMQMNFPDMQYAIVEIPRGDDLPGWYWYIVRYDAANTHCIHPDESRTSDCDYHGNVLTLNQVIVFNNLHQKAHPYHAVQTTQRILEEIYAWGLELKEKEKENV